jgi:hypothetical protein
MEKRKKLKKERDKEWRGLIYIYIYMKGLLSMQKSKMERIVL